LNRLIVIAAAWMLATAGAADASAQSSEGAEESYSAFYSKGMQAYVDGDYEEAIDLFYRAYGMDAKPVVARLIVRSYDFMGACDAARRQQEFYSAEHPDGKNVALQQCSNPARVQIECGGVTAPVVIDEHIEAACGETVSLPAGSHVLHSPALDSPATVDVEAGEARAVSLAVDPKKWAPATGDEHPRKWGVDRVGSPKDGVDNEDFSVYQSRDGLYRVWVRYDLLKDPDMHSGDEDQPRVLRLCDVDQTYDDAEENCVPLEPLQIEKVE
jgi:hypothetical protein